MKAEYILEMMQQNDTLTIRRGVDPMHYFKILSEHQARTGCKRFRLEALGSAIPNLVRVSQMLELCGLASFSKVSVKPRSLKEDFTMRGSEKVLCKFLQCMKVDMQFCAQAQPYPSKQAAKTQPMLYNNKPVGTKKQFKRYNDYSPQATRKPDKPEATCAQQSTTNLLGSSDESDVSIEWSD